MAKIDLKKPLIPAAILTIVVFALQLIFSKIGMPVKQLFASINPTTPLTPTIGTKVIGWLGNYVTLPTLPAIIVLFISAYLILLVGGLIAEALYAPKDRIQRLALIIIYGAAVFYLVIVGFTYPAALSGLKGWIGFFIYVAIASYITAFIMDKLNVKGY